MPYLSNDQPPVIREYYFAEQLKAKLKTYLFSFVWLLGVSLAAGLTCGPLYVTLKVAYMFPVHPASSANHDSASVSVCYADWMPGHPFQLVHLPALHHHGRHFLHVYLYYYQINAPIAPLTIPVDLATSAPQRARKNSLLITKSEILRRNAEWGIPAYR